MSARKTGTPCSRQLLGHELEGLGLAGAGRAGDEAVAVHRRQGDPHRRVGVRGAVDDAAPELERGPGERVPRADLVDRATAPARCGLGHASQSSPTPGVARASATDPAYSAA